MEKIIVLDNCVIMFFVFYSYLEFVFFESIVDFDDDVDLIGSDLVLVDMFDSDMCSVDFLLDDYDEVMSMLCGFLKVFVWFGDVIDVNYIW